MKDKSILNIFFEVKPSTSLGLVKSVSPIKDGTFGQEISANFAPQSVDLSPGLKQCCQAVVSEIDPIDKSLKSVLLPILCKNFIRHSLKIPMQKCAFWRVSKYLFIFQRIKQTI
jgi:hypothetical protein